MTVKKRDLNKKTHWFYLSFMVPTPGSWEPVSFYGSYTSKILTIPALTALREAHGIPASAKGIAISYIGLASQHTIAGTSDAPVPTKMSEAYRQGLTASFVTPASGGPSVVNPYAEFANGSDEMHLNTLEWTAGYAEGNRLQEVAKTLGVGGEDLTHPTP